MLGDDEMSATVLDQLFEAIPPLREFHAPTSSVYALLRMVARKEVRELFAGEEGAEQPFGPFGNLKFPYTRMGAIDSLDLFGIDELIIFAFYRANRHRYRKTLDLGANIGIHSIVQARNGFDVTCYEPDPHHFDLLNRNFGLNQVTTVKPVNAAVSTRKGTMEFVRVLGNTTGSHLAGAKSNVYGGTDRFPVEVLPFADISKDIDFIKMDVEGHEAEILTGTSAAQWRTMDAMVEIGNENNAKSVFEHFRKIGVGLFAQKISWHPVGTLEDMPTSHRDGSLFITTKKDMPWS
jgi:FkbM family methyltransferase